MYKLSFFGRALICFALGAVLSSRAAPPVADRPISPAPPTEPLNNLERGLASPMEQRPAVPKPAMDASPRNQPGVVTYGQVGIAAGKERRTIRIGVEYNSPPLSYVSIPDQPEGFTVELLREIGFIAQIDFVYVQGSWTYILAEFKAGRIDALANTLINEDRVKFMDFSIGHTALHSIIFSRPEDAPITLTAQFPGKKMAALRGTQAYFGAMANQGWGARIVPFDTYQEMLTAVKNGDCDFALSMRLLRTEFILARPINLPPQYVSKREGEALRIESQPDELGLRRDFMDDIVSQFHIAVHKGDARNLAVINEGLATVRANGTFDRLYAKWIGPIQPRKLQLKDLRPYLLPIGLGALFIIGIIAWQQAHTRQLGRQAGELQRNQAALQKAAEKMQQLQTADLQQLAQDRQAQFQLSENRYRSLVDASPDAILVAGPSGKIDLVNPAATSLFGYAFSELLNRSVEQLIPTALVNAPAAAQLDHPPASEPRSLRPAIIDLNARRKDGSEFPAEVSLSSVASPTGSQVIWVIRDGSVAKQAARQMTVLLEREKNISQMKTRFISLTSHEFRTPMAAAMGSVEILTHHLDRLDQVKRQSLLVRITASLQHMNRMLDDILLLNRADAARVDIRLRPVDLAQELQSILHDGELADGAQHTFHFAPTTADPAFVSDPNLLQHIFSNLLSNAVRYSPVGTTITLRLSFTVDAAIVEVEDQGIGIPLADQARIFDPFERGSNIGLIAGTGLGLNIVQRMVGLLQGTVAVSSITAGGTNFTVVLPRVIGPAPQP